MRHLLIFASLVVPALAQSLHAENKTARRQRLSTCTCMSTPRMSVGSSGFQTR